MTRAEAQSVDAGTFTRLMEPFEPFEKNPVVAVGVSGGRDSLALSLLSHDWAAARRGHLVALIVDHGLRVGSDMEAARTRDLLERLGIRHVLTDVFTYRDYRYGKLDGAQATRDQEPAAGEKRS